MCPFNAIKIYLKTNEKKILRPGARVGEDRETRMASKPNKDFKTEVQTKLRWRLLKLGDRQLGVRYDILLC